MLFSCLEFVKLDICLDFKSRTFQTTQRRTRASLPRAKQLVHAHARARSGYFLYGLTRAGFGLWEVAFNR